MAKRIIHVLLEPEQYQALVQIARREGRSASDLARVNLQKGIDQRPVNRASQIGVNWVQGRASEICLHPGLKVPYYLSAEA